MRNGKLLAEDSPAILMTRYNTYILEDIVIQLCLRDDSNDAGENDGKVPSRPESSKVLRLSSKTISASHLDEPDLNFIPDHNDESPERPQLKRRPSIGEILHRASDATAIQRNDLKTETTEKMERIYALLTKNVIVLVRNYM